MRKPFVSVLMPVYNGERFLAEAIESILKQSFTDFEFIIVDDGSTDSTAQILADYAAQDQRIVLLSNERNFGLVRSLNRGIESSRGVYIARQDADDLSKAERLSKQVEFMEKHPEIGVLGTWIELIDQHGMRSRLRSYPSTPNLVRWSLLFDSQLVHPSVLMRRSLIQKVGAYSEDRVHAEDYDLWSRLSFESQLANLPECLLSYRMHLDKVSVKFSKIQRETANEVSQAAISRLLGENIEMPDIMVLRQIKRYRGDFHDLSFMKRATKLILKLYQTYLQVASLSEAEVQFIRATVFLRLILLATKGIIASHKMSEFYVKCYKLKMISAVPQEVHQLLLVVDRLVELFRSLMSEPSPLLHEITQDWLNEKTNRQRPLV